MHSTITKTTGTRSSLPQMLRSIELIATDLERLTELTRDCVRHLQEVDDLAGLEPQALRAMVESIRSGIQLVEPFQCLFPVKDTSSAGRAPA